MDVHRDTTTCVLVDLDDDTTGERTKQALHELDLVTVHTTENHPASITRALDALDEGDDFVGDAKKLFSALLTRHGLRVMPQVYVAAVYNDSGTNVLAVAPHMGTAWEALATYADTWWGHVTDDLKPVSRDDLVADYFSISGERCALYSFPPG